VTTVVNETFYRHATHYKFIYVDTCQFPFKLIDSPEYLIHGRIYAVHMDSYLPPGSLEFLLQKNKYE